MDHKDSDSSTSLTSSREDLDEYVLKFKYSTVECLSVLQAVLLITHACVLIRLADQSMGDKTSTSTSLSSDSSPAVTPLPFNDNTSGMQKVSPSLDANENGVSPVLSETRKNVAQLQQSIMQHRQITTSMSQVTHGSSLKIDSRFAEEMRIILERKTLEGKFGKDNGWMVVRAYSAFNLYPLI